MSQAPDPARRAVIAGLASLPLAAIVADPALAQAAAEQTERVSIQTVGGRSVAGWVARPANTPAPAPAVILVHEWWGLNDQIRTMAVELARAGFLTLALDLFDGRVATDAQGARELTEAVVPDEAADTLTSWVQWLKNHPDGTRKVAAIGWCFGGGWALRAATMAPVDATVVYYGKVDLPPAQLRKLQGPVLGHFATRDRFVTRKVVTAFERGMAEANKPFTVYWYEADHAFANPTGAHYHQADAKLAWSRTLSFLKTHLE